MFEIRAARPEEAGELSAIARAAKASWGYPGRWLELWSEALTVTPQFVRENPVFVAVSGTTIEGFIALVPLTPREWSLEHLWVRPSAMRKGLGRRLVEFAAEHANRHGAGQLAIDAEPLAEPFYTRLGAVRVGEVVGSIEGQPRIRPQLVLSIGRAPDETKGSLPAP